jgi:hypothetical protein
MAREITNFDDIIDSRDVIERIRELEDELENPGLDQEDREAELSKLRELADQCSGYGDWDYGSTLIRDSYFGDYAMELADDIGAIDANATWPVNCIDWDQAARELQMDYTSAEFDGVTYWLRS